MLLPEVKHLIKEIDIRTVVQMGSPQTFSNVHCWLCSIKFRSYFQSHLNWYLSLEIGTRFVTIVPIYIYSVYLLNYKRKLYNIQYRPLYYKGLMSIANTYDCLDDYQYGFMKGCSMQQATFDLVSDLYLKDRKR